MDDSNRANLIIVSGPSGVGKSTMCDKLLDEFSKNLVYSISYTTRAPRDGEKNGHEYFFIGRDEFRKLIDEDYFAEWEKVHGEYYGTPRHQIEKASGGKYLVMDINVAGAEQLKKVYPDSRTLFMLPPSIDELERRLVARHNDKNTDDINIRLKVAGTEVKKADSYDYKVVNNNFDETYAKLRKIVENIIKSR